MRLWTFVFPIILLTSIPIYMLSYKFITSYHGDNDKNTYPLLAADPPAMPATFLNPAVYDEIQDYRHFPASLSEILPRLHSLDCPRMFNQSDSHVHEVLREGRITLVTDPASERELNMSCAAVRARWAFPESADSQAEAQFPIAFVRTVYRDYLLIEQMLAIEYAPQNVYCYALDSKASELFKTRIHSLAACFPNVLVASREFDVQSNGKNVTRSHLACLEELTRDDGNHSIGLQHDWKYAILLQNQDIPIRTNAEIVEILIEYNGTNEVGTLRITPGSIRDNLDWSLESLQLYKNGSNPWTSGERMHHTKSLNLVALSRPAANFMVNQLQLNTFIDRLEQSHYGMDEVFTSSLNSNLPDFPGGYTWRCLVEKGSQQEPTTRYVIWAGGQDGRCSSGYFRHSLCVMGLEDLWKLSRLRFFLYANKMLPEFDYGAIHCWLRLLTHRRLEDRQLARTKRGTNSSRRLNMNIVANLPHVRYNRLKAAGRLDKFYC